MQQAIGLVQPSRLGTNQIEQSPTRLYSQMLGDRLRPDRVHSRGSMGIDQHRRIGYVQAGLDRSNSQSDGHMNGHFRADADHLCGRLKTRISDAYTIESEGKILGSILPVSVR